MAELYGYVGKILRVNLTTRQISEFSSEKYYPYLGSKGWTARIYWEEIGPDVQPFDPENKLIFAAGPATGTGAIGSSKSSVAAKSPVWYPVHSFIQSNASMFGPALKRAGYDALIVEGKAELPVYLWIVNGKVEFRDAQDLWGSTTRATRASLWKKHNKQTIVACIGPAGENLVTSACISMGVSVAFGRGGFGAVMGSKKLKAIAVYGTGRIKVAQPSKILEINRERAKFCSIKLGEKRVVGGKEIVGVAWDKHVAHDVAVVQPGGDTQLSGLSKLGKVRIKPNACEACAFFCRTKYDSVDGAIPSTSLKCTTGVGWAFAEAMANNWTKKLLGPASVDFAVTLDDLGLNMNDFTIMAPLGGCTTAFDENECIEEHLLGGDWLLQGYLHGIFTEENTELPWSKFGTKEFNDQFLKMITYREGFGDVLARGFRYATQYIVEHEEFGPNRNKMMYIYKRIHSKAGNMGCLESGHGQFAPNPGRAICTACGDRTGAEPEFYWGLFTTTMRSPTPNAVREKWIGPGANKLLDPYYWGPEVAHAAIQHERYSIILDSLQACTMTCLAMGLVNLGTLTSRGISFTRDPMDWIAHTPTGGSECLSAIFGREVTDEELNETADRITNLIRAIWIRDGYTTVDHPIWGKAVDTLWDLHFERKDYMGRYLIPRSDFEAKKQDYYKERGWINGVPTRATLERLGLKDVADDLAKRKLLPAS